MAFARSASGPAGLSINTGAANTFGSTSSQPPAASGLFGAASATQPSTQATSLFGGNATASQPAQATSSLFGAPANTNQQQQQPQQQQQQQQQQQPGGGGGGLFGSSMASTSKPGGLFGGLTTNNTTTGGGLFGGSAANPTATAQPAGGSFFGQSAPQQPAQAAGGGLFGQQSKPAASLFGGATANTQTSNTTGGLFGQKPAAPAGGLFGGAATANPGRSLFTSMGQQPGSQPQQQAAAPALGSTMGPQAVVPGVRIDLSNLRNTTRFNDLQEDLQKEIAAIDAHVQGCMAQKDQVDAFLPQHEAQLQNIPGDVRFVSRKYAAVDSALGADLLAIKHMRDQVQADAAEARLSFTAVNNLVLPSQYHVSPGFFGGASSTRDHQRQEGGGADADGAAAAEHGSSSEDLVSYFSRATDEMDEQIKRLQRTVKEIDTHLGGVQQNIMEQASRLQAGGGSLGGGSGQDERVMELYHVLRDFEESIVQVATVVGGAREGVTELQMNDFRGRASAIGY